MPASFEWRVFTRKEALQAGILPGRLRRSDLTWLRSCLYARTSPERTELDMASAMCRGYPRATVMGLSAARLYRLPLPLEFETWTTETAVHLAAPGGRKGSDALVRWHNVPISPADIRDLTFWRPQAPTPPGQTERLAPETPRRLPLRITSRARTWRDLADHLDHVRLVAVGDHLAREPRPGLEGGRRRPWCTLEELSAQCTGRRAPALRAALADVRIGADSPRETLLRLAFRRAGLPEPRINVPLLSEDGRVIHTPDFQWPDMQVIAEYDGAVHNSPRQVAKDIDRARRATQAGWTEVRLHAADIGMEEDCRAAVDLVRAELRAKGWAG